MLHGTGLKPGSVQQMLSPHTGDLFRNGHNIFWGLGFGIGDTPSGRAFRQWGDNGIFKSYAIGFKESGKGVVFLVNSSRGLGLADEITRYATGEKSVALSLLGYEQRCAGEA